MRRALLLFLLGTPTFAAAGTITASDQTINLAQCSGTRNTVLDLDDEMDVDLSWTVTPVDDATAGGGLFRVYASRQQSGAGKGDVVSCTQNAQGEEFADGTFAQIGEDIPTTTLSSDGTHRFSLADVMSATGLGCTGTSPRTVYLCVQWFVEDQPSGWALTTLNFDPRRPTAPTNVTVSPGDRSLRVTGCSADDAAAFKALATGGGQTFRSNQAGECDGLRFTGLTNGTTYSVVVYSLNSANNPSEEGSTPYSDLEDTTPVPTDDFWEHYDGAEQGGCSTAAGATGILSALALVAAAAAARRRKP